jgi:N-acetylglucosaminyldiphosphoundecaprenol N-acetyl-beta-D-mannosaminyltransferase
MQERTGASRWVSEREMRGGSTKETKQRQDDARSGPLAARAVRLMGLDFAAVSEGQTIEHVLTGVTAGRGGWVCPANLDVLRRWRESADVRALISGADLVVADGMPLIWAGELQGSPLPQRVAGSTLILSLSAAAAAAGASVFLLGGNPGTADGAARNLAARDPQLRVAGTLCPPRGFEQDAAWLDRIEKALRDTSPDIVFVGLGFPKQERLIVRLRERMPTTWFVSCGISFSFVAGEIQRAPVLVQRLGLEWFHRLVQEPERLFRRYLLQGVPFLTELLWSVIRIRVRQAGRSIP